MTLFALQSTAARAASQVWSTDEKVTAVASLLTGLAVAALVVRFVRQHPWPRPFRAEFALRHLVAGPAFALAWCVSAATVRAVVLRRSFGAIAAESLEEMLFIGTVLYVVVAGLTYAIEGSARAARAEALAARSQLAALRAQIHPHFLFNALHAVVQLIPVAPARAAEAAELVADLLRASVEEQRDEVTLGDEWRFVSRYLDVERIRFGERLVVRAEIDGELLDERVPAFALQTLVENAVRHGAAHRVQPTEIAVTAARSRSELTLIVRNAACPEPVEGNGAAPAVASGGAGTGLSRLRERLAVLYGGAARLASGPTGGAYEAVLVLPRGAA